MKARSEVAVGDIIQFYPNDFRSHHAATCIVTKVKRRTFDCEERKGSYRAGKLWNIHMEYDFHYVWQESDGRWRFSRTG